MPIFPSGRAYVTRDAEGLVHETLHLGAATKYVHVTRCDLTVKVNWTLVDTPLSCLTCLTQRRQFNAQDPSGLVHRADTFGSIVVTECGNTDKWVETDAPVVTCLECASSQGHALRTSHRIVDTACVAPTGWCTRHCIAMRVRATASRTRT